MYDHPGATPPTRSTGARLRRSAGSLAAGAAGAGMLVILLVAGMWAIEVADYVLPGEFDAYGIRPWDVEGLTGIFLAPFLHADFAHLMANSLPLLVLGFLAALRGLGRFLGASLIIILVSGLGVWFTSDPRSVTVGASGLVFGYFGLVVARGLFDRRLLDIVIGVGVAVAYYSIIWGVLPTQEGVSWQGHLFGLLGGVLAAWIVRRPRPAFTPHGSPY
ncbi:rhomboid family intramembrane serine protease [Planomonospora parontospora]|uniref:rhomboid family intramembrane serine protease n=1 Tax=Planomonospora parontospora TaxID=58119 RepID=UPI0016702969|nr:rhomboid family intramembrane serine protease [Planomonospora parontospora]GGL07060.1 rhomboid family intramembrane serine protease [Planomonospora parontospora subsp. antibiotica]GII14141.1 rhomboid family intramembrane serine protease [Planomonospora parontospora subsp. antibiotica]